MNQNPNGYGNKNAPVVRAGKYDMEYLSNRYAALPENSDRCTWLQYLTSQKWAEKKQSNSTTFLWGISQMSLVNNFNNVYSGNNQFIWVEESVSPAVAPVTKTVTLANGYYETITEIMTELETKLNAATGGPLYVVSLTVGDVVQIEITPPMGETWSIVTVPQSSLTAVQANNYRIFGINTGASDPVDPTIIIGDSFPNIWSGLNTVYLICDALNYPFRVNTSNSSFQILLSFPLSPINGNYQSQRFEDIEWHETDGYTFDRNTRFSLVDRNGFTLEAIGGLWELDATMRTQHIGEY